MDTFPCAGFCGTCVHGLLPWDAFIGQPCNPPSLKTVTVSSPSTARFWPPQLPVFMFSGILQMRIPPLPCRGDWGLAKATNRLAANPRACNAT